jgi:hypothetical protein
MPTSTYHRRNTLKALAKPHRDLGPIDHVSSHVSDRLEAPCTSVEELGLLGASGSKRPYGIPPSLYPTAAQAFAGER